MPLPVRADISIMEEELEITQGRSAHSWAIFSPIAAPEAFSSDRVMYRVASRLFPLPPPMPSMEPPEDIMAPAVSMPSMAVTRASTSSASWAAWTMS